MNLNLCDTPSVDITPCPHSDSRSCSHQRCSRKDASPRKDQAVESSDIEFITLDSMSVRLGLTSKNQSTRLVDCHPTSDLSEFPPIRRRLSAHDKFLLTRSPVDKPYPLQQLIKPSPLSFCWPPDCFYTLHVPNQFENDSSASSLAGSCQGTAIHHACSAGGTWIPRQQNLPGSRQSRGTLL